MTDKPQRSVPPPPPPPYHPGEYKMPPGCSGPTAEQMMRGARITLACYIAVIAAMALFLTFVAML